MITLNSFNISKEVESQSIDELAEFYDPYSDLSLFLVQKITKEMRHYGKKWSLKVQEELLQKISPEFQKNFPHYRLGVAALKKTWEKVNYYCNQIQHEKEAITQDGKLNIHFFIKENLKQLINFKNLSHLHPSHFAHQLAMKMSECIATIDGIRPKLDHLTKLIWSIQRHLLPGALDKSPYDEYDKIDKLIVKVQLEITAKQPQVTHTELEHKVRESLQSLHDLPSFSSGDSILANVSALLAEKLYATSDFHLQEQKSAVLNFIRRHSALYKASVGIQLTECVRRILALYTLATGLPKSLTETEVHAAIQASYPTPAIDRPDHPQAFYAFLSAELVLMQSEEYCYSPAFVCKAIWTAYEEARLLPELNADTLEIVIWKTLSESENLLDKLPYKIGQRIEEEIAHILIDNPKQKFSSLVHITAQFFKRTKELVDIKKWESIEGKIHTWVMQGDMLLRGIRLEKDTPLMQLILQEWHAQKEKMSHQHFVGHICQLYTKEYPELLPYTAQLAARVLILYKHAWYTDFSPPNASSYARFLKWHAASTPENLKELVKRTLPLVPFDQLSFAQAS